MEPVERLEAMLELTEDLAEMTEAENLALADHRHGDVAAMLEDKAVLARLYENNMRDLEDCNLDWAAIDTGLRDKLRAAGERLRDAVEENTMRLEVGIVANRTVMEHLAQAMKTQVPHAGTYSRKGRTGREGATASANSLAISLDQTL